MAKAEATEKLSEIRDIADDLVDMLEETDIPVNTDNEVLQRIMTEMDMMRDDIQEQIEEAEEEDE